MRKNISTHVFMRDAAEMPPPVHIVRADRHTYGRRAHVLAGALAHFAQNIGRRVQQRWRKEYARPVRKFGI